MSKITRRFKNVNDNSFKNLPQKENLISKVNYNCSVCLCSSNPIESLLCGLFDLTVKQHCLDLLPLTLFHMVCVPVAAAAGGPGAGAGEGELSDPHGGGGGRDQRRQRHGGFGEQTPGNHTHTLSPRVTSVFTSHTLC